MLDVLIPMALSVLFEVIKNPEKSAQFRRALIKLRNDLNDMKLDGSK